jgi:predicted O-methyltransferase YrrM
MTATRAGADRRAFSGTAAEKVVRALAHEPAFRDWRAGRIDRSAYLARLEGILACAAARGVTRSEAGLSGRMHWRPRSCVRGALARAVERGVLASAGYDAPSFDRLRARVSTAWDHEDRTTYIFPEEAELLFAVASVLRPRRVAVLGSYYAYWALWALAGAGAALERAILLDVDADVNRLAEVNLARLGLGPVSSVITDDAIAYMNGTDEDVDLLVLEAEGPPTAADPRRCGKAIYGPMLEAALPRLRPGGVLVAHNVLLDDICEHPYVRSLVARSRRELGEFTALTSERFRASVQVATTEGTGIYLN